jgi:hypothetical protein
VWSYQGVAIADPNSTPPVNTPVGCNNNATITPQIAKTVPSAEFQSQAQNLPVGFGPVNSNGQNVVLWTINGTSMIIDPGKPTIQYVAEKNTSYPASYNLIEVSPTAKVSCSSPPFPRFPLTLSSGHTGSFSKLQARRQSLIPSTYMGTTCSS